jgi:hypothetical protein
MTKRLRITILCVGAAAGLGIAVAVAMSSKPRQFPKAQVVPQSPRLTATATALPDSPAQQSPTSAAPSFDGASPHFVPISEHPAALGAYRLFTQQIQNLQESFDHFREHQDRRQRNVNEAISELQNEVESKTDALPPDGRPTETPLGEGAAEALPPTVKRHEDGMLEFSLEDTNILDALKLLSQEADLDILVSKNVSGTVTASFRGVDVDAALAAILKSAGLVARNDRGIIYIGTTADLEVMDQI